jgi:UDP-3-O-acyl N-acetylglucosamine deacetylase
MDNNFQNTLGGSVRFSGIALHTGVRAHLTLHPADEGSGIIFRRIDVQGKPEVKALASNVVDVRRGTTIAQGNAAVSTVEHVLAVLYALNIDNAVVDMDGPEPPIADGSALPYLKIVQEAGIVQQSKLAEYWTPDKNLVFKNGETMTVFTPAESLKISSLVEYKSYKQGTQYYSSEITPEEFIENIASARTLVGYHELEQLIAMGLVKGGSLDNAIIMHDGAIICKEGLRYPDELVKHKVLDIIGDMALLGKRIKAHILAVKPGHASNVIAAQNIIAGTQ